MDHVAPELRLEPNMPKLYPFRYIVQPADVG